MVRGYPIPKFDNLDDPFRHPHPHLPTMDDLPSDDPENKPLADEFHILQPQFLSRTIAVPDYEIDRIFKITDMHIYYDLDHPLWYKRPDWFLVIDVPRLYQQQRLRNSYVMWQEERRPSVVVELLSPGTEAEDLGRFIDASSIEPDPVNGHPTNGHPVNGDRESVPVMPDHPTKPMPPGKLEVYEQILRIPYYVVYSRHTEQLRWFRLIGSRYEEQPLNLRPPQIWMPDLKIGLGIWNGEFEGIEFPWLRWCDADGNWLPTDAEIAIAQLADSQQELDRTQQELDQTQQALDQTQQERDRARDEAEQARTQLQQVARNLLGSGMAIAQVAVMLGISEEQIQEWMQE